MTKKMFKKLKTYTFKGTYIQTYDKYKFDKFVKLSLRQNFLVYGIIFNTEQCLIVPNTTHIIINQQSTVRCYKLFAINACHTAFSTFSSLKSRQEFYWQK